MIELLVGIGIVGTLVYYANYIYIINKLICKRRAKFANVGLAFIGMLLLVEFGLVSYYGELYHMIIAFTYTTMRVNEIYCRETGIKLPTDNLEKS